MAITTFLVDLDDTLYPATSGIWTLIGKRIDRYIHERLGLPAERVTSLRKDLFNTYGTTLRGLQIEYGIDTGDYLAFVHDVPIEELVHPSPQIAHLLKRYPQRKLIFTNADSRHAQRVLHAAGLEDCFESIIDILDITPYCKPQPESYAIAFRLAGVRPEECLMIDDSARNLAPARQMGCTTIRIGQPQPDQPIDFCIPSITQLDLCIPPTL
jgi:putative hydrolase of the HAD superfamily